MSNSDRRYSFGADFQFRESDRPYQRVLRFLLIVFATAFVLTVVLYSIFALAVNTDVEGRLKRENKMYEKLYSDLVSGNKSSPIFTQHIDYVNSSHYKRRKAYTDDKPDQIVTDYIASMTDDYFIDLFSYLFPNDHYEIKYRGYFD